MSRDIYPVFPKSRVNAAGKRVKKNTLTFDDVIVIENWRASHTHVLNTFQATLRRMTKGKSIVVAQRLKRKNTIFDKLKREPGMALSTMHDIAGCRLIFKNIKELNDFRNKLHKARFKHVRKKADEDAYNYIANPKGSGYRGVHDVYEYRGKESDKWDLLNLEIQYRTTCQHAWATAVEIAGSITANQPKFNKGDERYKEFFKLASEIISRTCEKSFSCYPDLSNEELLKKFNQTESSIHLLRTLRGINTVSVHIQEKEKNNKNMVLVFTPEKLHVYTFYDASAAVQKYFELEKSAGKNDDIVLVRADSNESVRNAFRNYFSDAKEFVRLMDAGIKELKSKNKRTFFLFKK